MNDSNSFSLFKDFLGTIPEILWPVVFILALFLLTRVVPAISKKLRERAASKKMSEFHFDMRLLEETLMIAREELGDAEEIDRDNLQVLFGTAPDAGEILETVPLDPELGIIKLIGLLDKETRRFADAVGGLEHRRLLADRGPMKTLVEKRYLPKPVARSIEVFTSLSNKVVRREIATHPPDVQRVLEMGLVLFDTVRSLHDVANRVYKVDVDLFSDPACRNVIADVKGVIIEKVGPQGRRMDARILPTSKRGYYLEGKRVSWAWNVERLHSTAYYVEPDTGEKGMAWESSAEFSGKHLDGD